MSGSWHPCCVGSCCLTISCLIDALTLRRALCCCALPAGIHTFSPDLSYDRPLFMVSYLAMELLGPTCWEAANAMYAQHNAIVGSSEGWTDDEELDMPLRAPSTEWIVKTGQGMLKVRPFEFQQQQLLHAVCVRQARLSLLPCPLT